MKVENRSLTGIRGLAALFVVIFHSAGNFSGTGPGATFLRHGYNSVDFFFVLSGFVLALTYGQEMKDRFSKQHFVDFLARRFARIYPLYAVVTVLTFIVFQAHLSTISPLPHPIEALTLNLLLIQAWGLCASIVGPAWSISTEWGAYLIFPALIMATFSRSHWLPSFLLAVAVLVLLTLAYGPDSNILGNQQARLGPLDLYGTATLAPVARCFGGFSLGLLAFRWRQSIRPVATLPLAIVLLGLMMLHGTDLLLVGAFTLLVMGLSEDTGLIARLLGSRIVYATGIWSYSIYLLHPRFNPVKQAFDRGLLKLHIPPTAAEVIAIGMSALLVTACAAVTYRFLEQPARRILNSVLVRRRRDTSLVYQTSQP